MWARTPVKVWPVSALGLEILATLQAGTGAVGPSLDSGQKKRGLKTAGARETVGAYCTNAGRHVARTGIASSKGYGKWQKQKGRRYWPDSKETG